MFLILPLLSVNGNDVTPFRGPQNPRQPQSPQYQDSQQYEQQNASKKTTKKEKKQKRVEVIVILGTTDEVRGYIYLPRTITFKHYKNGLTYEKTIEPEQLQSIDIKEYSKHAGGGSKSKKRVFYRFEPSLVLIKLTDRTDYRVNGMIPALKSFVIETVNGKTKLYSIFGDTFVQKKGWENADSTDPDYHRKIPHPAAVKKIFFIHVVGEN